MKPAPLLLGTALLALLSACAPTLTASHPGRIVNTTTGQEGTVQFLPGSLTPQAAGATGVDNVVITIGADTYTGRTVLLDAGSTAPQPYGFSVAFGGSTGTQGSGVGWNVGYGPKPAPPQATLKTGNLIARTASTPTRTLTCTLTVDSAGRGIGECTDQTGVKYALQF